VLEDLGPFVDVDVDGLLDLERGIFFGVALEIAVANFFSGILRRGDTRTPSLDRPRIRELGDINGLHAVDVAFPSRPRGVQTAAILEDGRIDGPAVVAIGKLALHDPLALERIGRGVLEYPDSMRLVRAGVGGAFQIVRFDPVVFM